MEKKAWVVSVDMGYGHQRAAYPLKHLSPTGHVINANNYPGIPKNDLTIWKSSRRIYEFISRLTRIPLVGQFIFNTYDKFQAIPKFYPRRNLSKPNFQLKQMYALIHSGWGKDLIDYLNQKDIPLITTFFAVAFFAEEHDFKNDIYCVLCDADISRTWVALNPAKSRIKYLAPCRRVVERLKLYGVLSNRIFLTGFPLPEENLGGNKLERLKADLADRIINLDPEKHYRKKYSETVKQFLKNIKIDERHDHPPTLTFAVGGAGAQKDLAKNILWSLKKSLINEEINFNLVAGSRNDVYLYFRRQIKKAGLEKILGKNLKIIFDIHKEDYFKSFSEALRTTDVLWTKPSELVFYAALGLPVITAPPIGSQEIYNKLWLKTIGAGIGQDDPKAACEWLCDWINSGWLAEAAMSGFLDGRQFGVSNIMDVVFKGVTEPTSNNLLL
ncbi:MAG: hypothetical protein COU29_04320 [Candidatus Magasanikbacteria bacterium CG10_big_fil_rev_8_21_14_0_10_36_32]|uniref:DUF6938 domain-containing protein n=1 Tax=Candidatus Magasanikbacteria bacterium CG10_big_fil_rev_8_21_14_0_10_36_32 TaxID=1974646 RepID=A0A2M6W5M3_9BACT|nr:MAG: hypothetical protein COU29_04320 [Candidatus Magasanikbacteria bacterium CG10_big_fil_rev_8_21_14_0_10_36_32]